MADLSLLQQAAGIMQKCGAFSYVQQGAVLPLLKSFIMPMVLAAEHLNYVHERDHGRHDLEFAFHLFRSGVQLRHGRAACRFSFPPAGFSSAATVSTSDSSHGLAPGDTSCLPIWTASRARRFNARSLTRWASMPQWR